MSKSSERLPQVSAVAATSLAAMQVDVTTHLGAARPATSTGLPTLDRLLGGGLRAGMLISVTGKAGAGKTALLLSIAYMAARVKAAVVVAGPRLDATEVVARLAARALHREYPEAPVTYGDIWTGRASNDDGSRRPVADAIDTVMKKVGERLHLYRAAALDDTGVLATCAAQQWARHDRVLLAVDDVEAFRPAEGAAQRLQPDFGSRLMHVGYELAHIAEQGACVLASVLDQHQHWLAPACTVSLRIEDGVLHVDKNRIGETGRVPLRFIPGAATLEEAAP